MKLHLAIYLILIIFSSYEGGVISTDDVSTVPNHSNITVGTSTIASREPLTSTTVTLTLAVSEKTPESTRPRSGLQLSDTAISSSSPSNKVTTTTAPSDPKEKSKVKNRNDTVTTVLGIPVSSSPEIGTFNNESRTISAFTTVITTETNPENVPPPLGSAGVSSWALIVISVLLAVAIGLSLIYALRFYNIRRRRSDRRTLLSSASQEGFFVNADNRYDNL